MTFATNLKAARLRAGMTQEQLALACGWSGQSRIGNYESTAPSAREPKVSEVPMLAKALGVTVAELFGEPSQSVGLHLPTLQSAIRLLELVAEIRGNPAPAVSAEAIAIAYEIVQSAGEGMDESNVVDFMRVLAARLDETKGEMDGAKRGPTARTG